MKRNTLLFIALATLVPAAAQAYTTDTVNGAKVRWPSNHTTLNMAPNLGSAYQTATQQTASRWNQNPSTFYFSVVVDNDFSSALGNSENEIAFTASASILDGAPAICYTWVNGSAEIVEADIFFDVDEDYTTSTSKADLWEYGGSFRPYQTTLTHELGHALGLGHEADVYNIMGVDWTHIHVNGSTAQAYPGEDASTGAVFLYGVMPSGFEDVGVVHWKYNPNTTGEYSKHQRTKIYSVGLGSLPVSFVNEEPIYEVSAGQTVALELTYENNGRTSQSATVEFRLSTNDLITTYDTLLSSISFALFRGTPYTTHTYVTIPSNLTSGTTYWLGAILDPENAITETNEDNNATYVGIKIK